MNNSCIPEHLLMKEDGEVQYPDEYFPEPTVLHRNLSLAFGVASVVFIVVSFVLYCYLRKYSTYLKARIFYLTVAQTIGSIFVFFLSGAQVIGRDNLPCLVSNLAPMILMNLVFMPFGLRLFLLFKRIRVNTLLSQMYFLGETNKRNLRKMKRILGTAMNESFLKDMFKNGPIEEDSVSANLRQLGRSKSENSAILFADTEVEARKTNTEKPDDPQVNEKQRQIESDIEKQKFYLGTCFASVVIFFHFVITFGIGIGLQETWETIECSGCPSTSNFILFFGLYSLLFLIYISYFLKNLRLSTEEDSLQLARELRLVFYICMPVLVTWAALDLSNPGTIEEDGHFVWDHILELAILLSFTICVPFQCSIAITTLDSKARSKLLQNSVSMKDLLKSHTGRGYFKAFLQRELKIEYYYFFREVWDWKEVFYQVSKEERCAKALHIYLTYLNVGARYQLQVNSGMISMAANFSGREGSAVLTKQIQEDVFDEALEAVTKTLDNDFYVRFLKSDLYTHYRSTLDSI